MTAPKDQLGNPSAAAPSSLASKPSQIHAAGTAGELRTLIPAPSKARDLLAPQSQSQGKASEELKHERSKHTKV